MEWVNIGSGNGLSAARRQAIAWTNAGLFSTGPLGTNFSEVLNEFYIFALKNVVCQIGGYFVQGGDKLGAWCELFTALDDPRRLARCIVHYVFMWHLQA